MAKFQSGTAWTGNAKGRPRGSENRFTELKEAFVKAFKGAGGTKRLTELCTKDPKKFMELVKLIASLLPKEQRLDFYARLERIEITGKSREEIIRELSTTLPRITG